MSKIHSYHTALSERLMMEGVIKLPTALDNSKTDVPVCNISSDKKETDSLAQVECLAAGFTMRISKGDESYACVFRLALFFFCGLLT